MSLTQFENIWLGKLESEMLNSFPISFISDSDYEVIKLPEKPLLKGYELFGNYEIIDTDGNTIYNSDNFNKIKYVLYANRELPTEINIVTNENTLNEVVKEYESHLDELVKVITDDFNEKFPSSDKATTVVNKIFQLLNLHRY